MASRARVRVGQAVSYIPSANQVATASGFPGDRWPAQIASVDSNGTVTLVVTQPDGQRLVIEGAVRGSRAGSFSLSLPTVFPAPVAPEAPSGGGGGTTTGAATSTTEELTLWVDGASGDDGNTGVGEANALATIEAAEAKVPDVVAHTTRIRVKAGTYSMPVWRARQLKERLIVEGTEMVELEPSTAALGGTGQTVVVTSGLTLDEYVGKTIEILTGAAAGDRRTIRDNTTTNITPCERFSAAVASGDTFRICEPAAVIDLDANSSAEVRIVGGTGATPFYLVNLAFVGTTAPFGQSVITSGTVCLLGVECRARAAFNVTDTIISGKDRVGTGASDVEAGPDVFGTPSSLSWQSWCVSQEQASALTLGCINTQPGTFFEGWIVAGTFIEFTGAATLFGGRLYGDPTGFNTSLGCFTDGVVQLTSAFFVLGMLIDAAGSLDAVQVTGAGSVSLILATISAVNGNCLESSGAGSTIQCSFGVSGASTGGVGSRALRGGRIEWTSAPACTGGANDISVGETPTVSANAGLAAAGDYIREPDGANDGSIVQRIG